MGVSGGVWECGKPERFSIISMPKGKGEKGEPKSGPSGALKRIFYYFSLA